VTPITVRGLFFFAPRQAEPGKMRLPTGSMPFLSVFLSSLRGLEGTNTGRRISFPPLTSEIMNTGIEKR
jgi:hypothetical protein